MIRRHEVSKDQAMHAISNGEFGSDILDKENVIVIMTQDWCSQWIDMKSWIYGLETDMDIDIYELVYNKTDYGKSFMEFKERVLGNSLIPYLRIYKNGRLAGETNYTGRQKLMELLK